MTALSIRPITATIGAEISGVDLSQPLDDATRDGLATREASRASASGLPSNARSSATISPSTLISSGAACRAANRAANPSSSVRTA